MFPGFPLPHYGPLTLDAILANQANLGAELDADYAGFLLPYTSGLRAHYNRYRKLLTRLPQFRHPQADFFIRALALYYAIRLRNHLHPTLNPIPTLPTKYLLPLLQFLNHFYLTPLSLLSTLPPTLYPRPLPPPRVCKRLA